MALLTTLEGEDQAAGITVEDLFNVNDYMGVRIFGVDAWNKVKQAAAIIAQKAANSPYLFYLRSQGSANSVPGQYSQLGRDLWGYNDRDGVELMGAATWGAVKNQFDELLGVNWFNPMTYVTAPVRFGKWVADKMVSTDIPVIKDVGNVLQATTKVALTATDPSERLYNVIEGKGYYTQDEIDEATKREKAAQREQMLKDASKRASESAAKAEAARGEYEKAQAELKAQQAALEQMAQQTGLTTAAEAQASLTMKTAVIVVGGVAAVWLLTRNKKAA